MSERIEAAAQAIYDKDYGYRLNMTESEGMAEVALDAADAADPLRNPSPEQIERAAEALHDLGCATHPWPWSRRDEEVQELYREDVRAVIAALKDASK